MGTTRSWAKPVLLAVAVAGLLALAATGPALALLSYRLSDTPPTTTAAPSERDTAPSDAAGIRFGDGTYLDGNRSLRGVNIYSLIFPGQQDDLSQLGEPASSYAYLAARGTTIVRLAVPWQRLQEIPAGGDAAAGLAEPVSDAYLDVIEREVTRAADAGIRTVIDLHNGCTYPWGAGDFVEGSLRCGQGIEEHHVTAIWTALAGRFVDDERVAAFDIFNEPRWSVGVHTYKRYAQVAVDAIRATGAEQTLWVEGILSDTRGRLTAIAPDGPWIIDPLDRVMYSEHFYANVGDQSYPAGAEAETVLERLRDFGVWCQKWGVRCAVGEVGWPSQEALRESGMSARAAAEGAAAWNALFDRFYDMADTYEMDVTYFAASSVTTTGTLLAYVSSDPALGSAAGIDTARSQSEVIERHLSQPR